MSISGWWLNQPSEKYARQIGSFPQGWKFQKCLKPPRSPQVYHFTNFFDAAQWSSFWKKGWFFTCRSDGLDLKPPNLTYLGGQDDNLLRRFCLSTGTFVFFEKNPGKIRFGIFFCGGLPPLPQHHMGPGSLWTTRIVTLCTNQFRTVYRKPGQTHFFTSWVSSTVLA